MFSTPSYCDAFLVKGISTLMKVFSLMDKRNIDFRQDNPLMAVGVESNCDKKVMVLLLAGYSSMHRSNKPTILPEVGVTSSAKE
jgi:hypothetical protein